MSQAVQNVSCDFLYNVRIPVADHKTNESLSDKVRSCVNRQKGGSTNRWRGRDKTERKEGGGRKEERGPKDLTFPTIGQFPTEYRSQGLTPSRQWTRATGKRNNLYSQGSVGEMVNKNNSVQSYISEKEIVTASHTATGNSGAAQKRSHFLRILHCKYGLLRSPLGPEDAVSSVARRIPRHSSRSCSMKEVPWTKKKRRGCPCSQTRLMRLIQIRSNLKTVSKDRR